MILETKAEIFHTKHDLGNNIRFNSFSLSLLWHFTHQIWLFTVLIFVCKAYKVSLNHMKYTVAAKSVCFKGRKTPANSFCRIFLKKVIIVIRFNKTMCNK